MRYGMWAGQVVPQWFTDTMSREGKEVPGAIWPIVDNDTCGEIRVEPKVSQMLCVCFRPEDQRLVFDALEFYQWALRNGGGE